MSDDDTVPASEQVTEEGQAVPEEGPALEEQWYWDRRNRKAYYPVEQGDTVRLVTVWHREEVADAVRSGALVPADEVGLDRVDTTFDLLDSFRFPEDVSEGGTGSDGEGGDGE